MPWLRSTWLQLVKRLDQPQAVSRILLFTLPIDPCRIAEDIARSTEALLTLGQTLPTALRQHSEARSAFLRGSAAVHGLSGAVARR